MDAPHGQRARESRRLLPLALLGTLLGAPLMGGCEDQNIRSSIMSRERVAYCINHVCPITGNALGDWAFAVEFRGYHVGVYDREAVTAWHELPEWQQQGMLRYLVDHAETLR